MILRYCILAQVESLNCFPLEPKVAYGMSHSEIVPSHTLARGTASQFHPVSWSGSEWQFMSIPNFLPAVASRNGQWVARGAAAGGRFGMVGSSSVGRHHKWREPQPQADYRQAAASAAWAKEPCTIVVKRLVLQTCKACGRVSQRR